MLKKLALCIGNDDYQYPCLCKLQCAVNDSNVVSSKLTSLGFNVTNYANLNRMAMHEAVDTFEENLADYDVGLFYYAGHGFECNGHNLLMPIDTDCTDKGYREWMALNLNTVIDALEGRNFTNEVKIKIIILDACRQNPDGRGVASLGFASIFAPKGSIIAFSTSPGQLASERGGHGLYTKALLQHIDTPRIPIENMFKHVRETLSAETNSRQISWEHTSLMGNFYFNEDRIDSGIVYSNDAFADSGYYFERTNPVGNIVAELKSHDWYTQNPAIGTISQLDFQNASANDLFVLGRNIYQSADGGAWSARHFIDSLHQTQDIDDDAKAHILNGMAFEIYFDRKGILRDSFKSDYYIGIINLLEMEMFQSSKNFISETINSVNDRIIYLPGSEERICFHLICVQKDENEKQSVLYIETVFLNGKKVWDDQDYDYGYSLVDQIKLRKSIAKEIVAPPDMVMITYNIDTDVSSRFAFPYQLSLCYHQDSQE